MRQSTMIINHLKRAATGPLVVGDVGSGFGKFKLPQHETAETARLALFYLLLDLSHDMGIRDKIDPDVLRNEIFP